MVGHSEPPQRPDVSRKYPAPITNPHPSRWEGIASRPENQHRARFSQLQTRAGETFPQKRVRERERAKTSEPVPGESSKSAGSAVPGTIILLFGSADWNEVAVKKLSLSLSFRSASALNRSNLVGVEGRGESTFQRSRKKKTFGAGRWPRKLPKIKVGGFLLVFWYGRREQTFFWGELFGVFGER